MKKLVIILIVALHVPVSAQDFKSADRELNQVYQQVIQRYGDRPEFVAKLQAAQRAWIKFRDAQVEAMYPAVDKQKEYGSVYPACAESVLRELTEARTIQLRRWLEGVDEGDACAGSIKLKAPR